MIKVTVTGKPNLERADIKKGIREEANIWMFNTVNKIKLDASGRLLNVRSGKLRADIKGKVKQSGNKTIIKIGSRKIPYSKAQDRGALIVPKTRRFLTVPVNQSVKGRARQYSNTVVIKSRKGNLIIAQVKKRKKKSVIKPLFILKRQVRIKKTGFITDNIRNRTPLLRRSIELRFSNINI
jgi:hypothetical protein